MSRKLLNETSKTQKNVYKYSKNTPIYWVREKE